MYVLLFLAIGVLPQADREALVLHRAQVQQEARLRINHPNYFAARQYQATPQTEINVYAPTYNYGTPVGMPYNYYGYGWGRPAWPPAW